MSSSVSAAGLKEFYCNMLKVAGFLDFMRHLEFWIKHSILVTGRVPILRWEGLYNWAGSDRNSCSSRGNLIQFAKST
jgi:hypothetical protein